VDNLAALEREGDRLRTAQLLSPEEVKALDLAAIGRFWQSEFGQKIRANAGLVRREVPFTLRLTREDLVAAAPPAAVPEGEYVVLQGVIDLAVLLAGEIWLVDFKTDDLKPSELDEKQQHYAPQLNLYALALEKIFCRPVKERWLHFLALGKTVAM
jgi:ATP-dependent helicase/nuclease subunit A